MRAKDPRFDPERRHKSLWVVSEKASGIKKICQIKHVELPSMATPLWVKKQLKIVYCRKTEMLLACIWRGCKAPLQSHLLIKICSKTNKFHSACTVFYNCSDKGVSIMPLAQFLTTCGWLSIDGCDVCFHRGPLRNILDAASFSSSV